MSWLFHPYAVKVPWWGTAQGDEGVDALVPTEPRDVVAGDEATHAVANDVDPLVAGLGDERLDLLGQLGGGDADVARQDGVVHRRHPAEASTAQTEAQQGEDRPVVDDPVDEEDRRAGGLHVGDHQAALHRWQVLDAIAVAALGRAAPDEAEGIDHDVRRHPQGLDRRPGEPGGRAECADRVPEDVNGPGPDLADARRRCEHGAGHRPAGGDESLARAIGRVGAGGGPAARRSGCGRGSERQPEQ